MSGYSAATSLQHCYLTKSNHATAMNKTAKKDPKKEEKQQGNKFQNYYLQKESIGLLHDVCFVNSRHALPAMQLSVIKRIFSHTQTGLPGDDLDAFHHPTNHLKTQKTTLT
jgi:hypothetical protein